jgi:hypothetical protein
MIIDKVAFISLVCFLARSSCDVEEQAGPSRCTTDEIDNEEDIQATVLLQSHMRFEFSNANAALPQRIAQVTSALTGEIRSIASDDQRAVRELLQVGSVETDTAPPPGAPVPFDDDSSQPEVAGGAQTGSGVKLVHVLVVGGSMVLVVVVVVLWVIGKVSSSKDKASHYKAAENGLLVEEWEKKEVDAMEYLRIVFQRLDEVEQSDDSPDGMINRGDLQKALLDDKLGAMLRRMGLTEEEAGRLFTEIDVGNTGLVDTEAFIEGCGQRAQNALSARRDDNRQRQASRMAAHQSQRQT